jgi:hypothetical protein
MKPELSFEAKELSHERAEEIFCHIIGEKLTQFSERDTNGTKRHLAEEAVKIHLEVEVIPEGYQEIIDILFPTNGFEEKRVGKKMSPERAKVLLTHLDSNEKDPHWREDDTVISIRAALRESANLTIMVLEKSADQRTPEEELLLDRVERDLELDINSDEIYQRDLRKIKEKYPLAA